MVESTEFRKFVSSLEGGVLITVLIALVSVAFYMGTIGSQVSRFENRVKDLEGLDGLHSEKRKAINQIHGETNESVMSARERIEKIVNQGRNALNEEIRALTKNEIENIFDAQRSIVEAFEGSNEMTNPATKILPLSSVLKLKKNLTELFSSDQVISETHLEVPRNKTYTVSSADMTFGSVTLQENSTLIVPSKFAKVTLHTKKFVTEKGAKIVARGKVGIGGKDGGKGKNGSTCEIGNIGRRGEPGLDGEDGSSVEIFTTDFVLADSLTVDTSGGNGGNGGRGGNGGNGGGASRSEGCGGRDGGNGENGGRAGDGGDSGALSIHYVDVYLLENMPIRLSIVRTLVKHVATPGTAGLPGEAGNGGFGGPGIARKSLPRGVDGINGTRGESGSPGIRGSTTIGQGL